MWWLNPIKPSGFWFLDLLVIIFIFWFFRKVFKGDKKKSNVPEITPEMQKKMDEEYKARVKKYEETERFCEELHEFLEESKMVLQEMESKNSKVRKKHRKKILIVNVEGNPMIEFLFRDSL